MNASIDVGGIWPQRVSPGDLDPVLTLLDDAARWLRHTGVTGQWPSSFTAPGPDDPPRDRISGLRQYARFGHLWLFREKTGEPIATCVVTHLPDMDFAPFWPGVAPGHRYCSELWDARYLYRMAVARRGAGLGIGALMVDFAQWQARNAGVHHLRLDCSRTNTALHAHYKSLGFAHVATAEVPGRLSGALFQREVTG